MFIDTSYRTLAPEMMDDFSMEGELLRDALDKIARINSMLGGNKITLEGVTTLLKNIAKTREITIADIGCGNGDMLRVLADYGARHHWKFNLIGIDANNFTISYAKKLSASFPNIRYECQHILTDSFSKMDYDIALCTLTLHHFKDNEIISLMSLLKKKAGIGIVINDLHRSAISYRLFQLVCFVSRLNAMSREDGLISILRGFKKAELALFSKRLKLNHYTLRWKWAFRYQWIISNI